MIAGITEFAVQCISGPNLLATALLLCVALYWLMTLITGMGLDLDFDIDLDADVSEGLTGLGFVSLKWLNLGDVPLMLWISMFAASMWVLTMTLDTALPAVHQSFWSGLLVLLRNGAIAVLCTKVLTHPFKGMTSVVEPNPVKDLIDKEGTANTEITNSHGQLRYELDGAPLLLNARTETGSLAKGDRARIVDYDPDTRVYLVVKVESEVPQ